MRRSLTSLPVLVWAVLVGGGIAEAAIDPNAAKSMSSFSVTGHVMGDTCQTPDKTKMCLGIHYLAFLDDEGRASISSDEAVNNVKLINKTWAQCGIAFQIDQYTAVKPDDYRIRHRIGNLKELEDIRSAFNTRDSLLIVTTGQWDRSGSLGKTGANAWTAMPGGGPYGAIIEQPVGKFSNILAHELGHYLNLMHAGERKNLMNPVIYRDSATISQSECSTARETAEGFWRLALR